MSLIEEFVVASAECLDFGGANEAPGFREEDQYEPVVSFRIGREADF